VEEDFKAYDIEKSHQKLKHWMKVTETLKKQFWKN